MLTDMLMYLLVLGLVGIVLCLGGYALYQLIQVNKSQDRKIRSLESDINALSIGAHAAGEKAFKIETLVRRVMLRQDQVDLKEPANQSYRQAIRLVKKGAEEDELVDSCGLARSEAELIKNIYNR